MTTIETITPEKAREYLNTSVGNRPTSWTFVRMYAHSMKAGKWAINGQTIKFDTDGHLIDGHHRLLAVIEAGIPVALEVRRGLQHEVFATLDNGNARKAEHVLAIKGSKNWRNAMSVVMAYETIKKSGRLYESNSSTAPKSRRMTNEEKVELYDADPSGFDIATTFAKNVAKKHGLNTLKVSWVGGIFYYLTHDGGYKDEQVKPFFTAIFNPRDYNYNACTLLREQIVKVKCSRKKMAAELLWGITAKAWNGYITGTPIRNLRYQIGKEELPKLIIM